eukprot:scaffold1046_cov118-Isochrysis_galbana.AAC.2
MSRSRLTSGTSSSPGTRTTGCAEPSCAACSCARTLSIRLGACSMSMQSQSRPECARASVAIGEQADAHSPTCAFDASSDCLNRFGRRPRAAIPMAGARNRTQFWGT